jgi:hypothetical protein
MIYKSAELVKEEQAIVEEALNSLVDEVPKKNLKKTKISKEMKQKIKRMAQKR